MPAESLNSRQGGIEHELGELSGRVRAVEMEVVRARDDGRSDKEEILAAINLTRSELRADHMALKEHVTAEINGAKDRIAAMELAGAFAKGATVAHQRHSAENHDGHIRWSSWVAAVGIAASTILAIWALRK